MSGMSALLSVSFCVLCIREWKSMLIGCLLPLFLKKMIFWGEDDVLG